MKLIKQAVYNTNKTECFQIGYYKTASGVIRIQRLSKTIKKVPSELPKEITSLKTAFSENINSKIEGIENWDVSNVTDMSYMFFRAFNFNQDISSWDTSKVVDMNNMFSNAYKFNQPIGNWNVSNVTNMSSMFFNALSFNQPIGNWNTSNVKRMACMFDCAENFNQDISNWDVSKTEYITNMFYEAESFDKENYSPKFNSTKKLTL
ncbi:BspA family leucine-rich repeat surface protein [Mycoplasma feriruminatoris]|uniref:Uncharacterized protein n=1 Tax=Mycoplasma feriruminatoris TaxID=1179777 RepID=A0AAX3TFX8_9MOLU|nr:BspA family leucine-rich repeat surface protein [Mycoplasma feriruminatoris]WFQ93042.1 hypothetical protein MFERI14822_00835 [Mycoplasma feriruminatoris]